MTRYVIVLLESLIVLLLRTKPLTAATTIGVTSVHCERNRAIFETLNITLTNNTIFVDMNLIQTLRKGFRGHVDVQLRMTNAKKFQSLFQGDVNYCQTLMIYKDSLIKRWIKSIMASSNFKENCPVTPGHYYLNGWHLDMSLIPSYLYNGDYRAHILGYYGKYRSKKHIMLIDCFLDVEMQIKK